MKLVKLGDKWLNPGQITHVMPSEDVWGETWVFTVDLADGDYFRFEIPPAKVAAAINKAMSE